ncbi:MAG: hypothetical protein ACK4Q5_03625, partial [Saprospiraceae bacterium]
TAVGALILVMAVVSTIERRRNKNPVGFSTLSPQIYLWENATTDRYFCFLKISKSMVATIEQEAPTAVTTDLAARKFRLIEHIIGLTDEAELLEIEGIVFDFPEADDDLSEEELALLDERIAEAKANPDAGIPFEQFIQNMKNRLRQ